MHFWLKMDGLSVRILEANEESKYHGWNCHGGLSKVNCCKQLKCGKTWFAQL